jgi:anti-anti-sigma factor
MSDFGPPPELRIVTRTDPATGAALVSLRGRLISNHTDQFYDEVKPLVSVSKRIVLDFNDVTHMDSSGLGAVIRLYVHAKGSGCEVQLMNLSKGILKIFSITNVLSFFTVIGENDIRIP